MESIVLILLAVMLYLSLWSTGIYYLVKMKNLNDTDKKLRLTYNSLGIVVLEQLLALIGLSIFYAIRFNDTEIQIPESWAIFSAIMTCIGFIATGYFWFFYRKRHFLEYVKNSKIDKRAIGLKEIIVVGLLVSVMNFFFNVMLAGAISYLQ